MLVSSGNIYWNKDKTDIHNQNNYRRMDWSVMIGYTPLRSSSMNSGIQLTSRQERLF